MRRTNRVRVVVLALLTPLLTAHDSSSQEVSTEAPFAIETIAVPRHWDSERLRVLAQALGFAAWPEEELLFVGPPVTKGLLSEPALVTREVLTCSARQIAESPWGECDWSWSHVVQAEAVSTEPDAPSRLEGELDLTVTLAPSARAAHEVLLLSMADNQRPTELLVLGAAAAERPEGLGSVSFVMGSASGGDVTVRFVRSNVAVVVRGTGRLAGEALQLARRIDRRVLDQQPLTYEQLLDKRPQVTLKPSAREEAGVPFQFSMPPDQRLVRVAGLVDGQVAPTRGNRVLSERVQEAATVEVLVITDQLLVGSARRELSSD